MVARRLDSIGQTTTFTYGRSYLARPEAIPLHLPELPLQPGRSRPSSGLAVPGCLADAAPEAWGRRVILARREGRLTGASDTADPGVLSYPLESGPDRIGGLDVQTSPTDYVPPRQPRLA